MTLDGIVNNGVIVLDQPAKLPEGARVKVVVEDAQAEGEPLRDLLMKYAGCMKDLPADLAEQHDHYIHGTPKR